MVVAQKSKEDEITEMDSLLLTRNLLRIAIFNISYIRGLFPEKYFNDKSVPALEMKIKKLMPMDAESRRLIDWMEKGVYDALQKKYLKTLLFCICKEIEGPMIEEYAFSFSYPNSNSEEVTMNVNRIGNKKNGAIFKSNTTEITPDQMRSSACKMVRTLVQLMRTLDQMPDERTILMKLLYYDNVTPADYEPPFFRSCSENEANSTWAKNPLKMEVGNVNSKHVVLALKVKSILDPCDDENDELSEDDASLGADSVHEDKSSSDGDDEVHPSRDDQYILVPIGEKRVSEDTDMHSEDDTQDAVHEEEQMARVKDWVAARHVNTVDLTDILSNFPDISVTFAEEITEKLSSEGFLSKVGKDSFTINRELSPNTCAVKQELDMQDAPQTKEGHRNGDEDYMYMKALYHALPLDYVTVAKLQSKLEGEANHTMVRKLIDRMVQDGYVQNSGSRKLGKRVIHSESSNKKLMEVRKALESKPMEMETDEQLFEFDATNLLPNGKNLKDGSTCGGLYSIGSDLTRTRGRSETYQNGSIHSAREQANTPTSKANPIASLESGTLGKGGRVSCGGDDIRLSPDKRSRRASTVKEPILQYIKRQKSQPRE